MKSSHLILSLILTALLHVQCKKDPILTDAQLNPQTLHHFLALENPAYTHNLDLAFASDHLMDSNNAKNQWIEFYTADEIKDVKLFITDTLRWKDSFELYNNYPIESSYPTSFNFQKINFKGPAGNYYARVLIRTDSKNLLSDAISIRSGIIAADTIMPDEILVELAANGYTNFRWPGIPATEYYLLRLIDNQGLAMMQLTVRRPEFNFYDLRGVEKNLEPTLRDPSLIADEKYTLKVEAVNQSNWLMASGTLNFIAP